MATIKFVDGNERTFLTAEEKRAKSAPDSQRPKAHWLRAFDELSFFIHHDGSPDAPQLFEARYPPNTKVESHAHPSDEIIVVTDGEVHFGKQKYGAGSSVFIPKMTLYSFQSGPEGLTFLNFRPAGNHATLTKEEFLELRKESATTPELWDRRRPRGL
ncbi:MAG TPA: hypothetical protein VG368_06060 [Acidimicrobiales bacterium]|jgi:quercetin dioxygenase-like cupin family protein|nr:hypothetical protein [Acidimicrobiales bacterium]